MVTDLWRALSVITGLKLPYVIIRKNKIRTPEIRWKKLGTYENSEANYPEVKRSGVRLNNGFMKSSLAAKKNTS